MKTLVAGNEDFIKIELGVLDADAAAGSNVDLTLVNNDGAEVDLYLAVGFEGNELCELQHIGDVDADGVTVTVDTLKFNHKKGEPVTVFRYNQRKFYGSDAADGTFTELTSDGSPKDIQVDDPMGTRLEYTGTDYTYFKATYYNSSTSEETDENDAEAQLADESLRYATLYAIRKHAGLAGNPRYSDLRIETKRKQAENEINSAIAARYVLPLDEVPPLISQICELLAAGYIDYEEFGKDGEGVKWLGEARALLKAIQTGRQLLIGEDGTELERVENSGRLSGYPNDEDTDAAKYSMADTY